MDTIVLKGTMSCNGKITEGKEQITKNGKITVFQCPDCKKIFIYSDGQQLPPTTETYCYCGADIIYVVRWDSKITRNKPYNGEGVCEIGWALRDYPYTMVELDAKNPMSLEQWKIVKLKPVEELVSIAVMGG